MLDCLPHLMVSFLEWHLSVKGVCNQLWHCVLLLAIGFERGMQWSLAAGSRMTLSSLWQHAIVGLCGPVVLCLLWQLSKGGPLRELHF